MKEESSDRLDRVKRLVLGEEISDEDYEDLLRLSENYRDLMRSVPAGTLFIRFLKDIEKYKDLAIMWEETSRELKKVYSAELKAARQKLKEKKCLRKSRVD